MPEQRSWTAQERETLRTTTLHWREVETVFDHFDDKGVAEQVCRAFACVGITPVLLIDWLERARLDSLISSLTVP